MADLQKYFLEYHDKIKLDYDDNATLREKRDIVLDKLNKNLKKYFDENKIDVNLPNHFHQGSYAMFTGVKPIDSDIDIDIGLTFKNVKDDFPDPVDVKEWVHKALDGHTKDVSIKEPCVRVQYQHKDDPLYHVDFAIYSDEDNDYYLARGKKYSQEENKIWQLNEPQKLIQLINEHFEDVKEREQYRRVIRYLKRWKDEHFSSDGNNAPVGIGLTVAAYLYFEPEVEYDSFENKYTIDDLGATYNFVDALISKFGFFPNRLTVELPVEPKTNIFEKMLDNQMENFQNKLETLRDNLAKAIKEVDPYEACKLLHDKSFGEDFPVPPKEETGKKYSPAILIPNEGGL